ncbi:hypothetical protein BGP79_04855 [Tersicoccus sp. Bi-70]|nr:hypothetical protein BGP79_04855 [Tersicoccus sp. Bi-70]
MSGGRSGPRARSAALTHPRLPAGTARQGRTSDRGPRPDAALLLDLLAAMLDAGVSIDTALALLAGIHANSVGAALDRVVAARRLGADWPSAVAMVEGTASSLRPGSESREALVSLGPLLEAVVFAATTGTPSAELLRSRAGELRGRRRRETERRAASLGVRLVLPLGLCQLPAFICLGIAPVVVALLPALGS